MRKKFNMAVVAVLLSGSVLFSSCIGSFGLFNKLLAWNKTVDDKFINELVFVAFWIVPIYEIAFIVDAVVLNSIEFWTGDNPVAEGQVKKVESENGNYIVTTEKDGYHIEKEGTEETVDLRFNKENKTWSTVIDGEITPLLQYTGEKEVVMFLANGTTMPVELSEAGVLAFSQVVNNNFYFANK